MKVLVLNAGSSSIKYRLFEMPQLQSLAGGQIEGIGELSSRHTLEVSADQQHREQNDAVADHAAGIANLLLTLQHHQLIESPQELAAIGHRVVHGGEYFHQPVLIDADVVAKIRATIPLAPLHNPANLEGIERCLQHFAGVPQVAVFDTAFHQTLPDYAYRYAVPSKWYRELGVRRYGFHGTSHLYVARKAAEFLHKPLAQLNLISLHLGNGASACAIQNGKSVDTSMGLTPLEGLIMGGRSGDIDPALVFYLQREAGLTQAEIENTLNKQSGLRGLCGENDMRRIHAMAGQGDSDAKLALQMFSYRIRKYIGAYSAVLGHVDALIFTGGIGENDAAVRASVCSNLKALGVGIDKQENQQVQGGCHDISDGGACVAVLVIKTDEEGEIAHQTAALCCA